MPIQSVRQPQELLEYFAAAVQGTNWEGQCDRGLQLYRQCASPSGSFNSGRELVAATRGWVGAFVAPDQNVRFAFVAQLALLAASVAGVEVGLIEGPQLEVFSAAFSRVATQSPLYAVEMARTNVAALESFSAPVKTAIADTLARSSFSLLRAKTRPGCAAVPADTIAVLSDLIGQSGQLGKPSLVLLADQLEEVTKPCYGLGPLAVGAAALLSAAVSTLPRQQDRMKDVVQRIIRDAQQITQPNGLTSKTDAQRNADDDRLNRLDTLARQLGQTHLLSTGPTTRQPTRPAAYG
jgi:hypothetical protein